MPKEITIALAGNPNVGKSVLFNALTGSRQHVGNWPGKTVEKKVGSLKFEGYSIKVVDLPGTYSLTAYSLEEVIARDYIINEKPDAVIHIVDSTNLERNLYLTVQLIELGASLVLALNMTDLAEKTELKIDATKLSHFLKVPVVKTTATKKIGVNELLSKAVRLIESKKRKQKPHIVYGTEIEDHVNKLGNLVSEKLELPEKYDAKWVALKLLENDTEVVKDISRIRNSDIVIKEAEKNRNHLNGVFGEDVDTSIADARYGFIAGMVKESVQKPRIDRLTMSDNIDKVVTNKVLGIPIFLLLMWLMFQITFTLGAPFMDLIDGFFGWLSENASSWVIASSGPEWLASLLSDGIIGGVGSVLVFIPNIFLLFLMIAILEDSGYMARGAFIMDRVMHKIGLHGKSFIPMILGFGCNVPAIMATRTLENKKDRILTILINPFMSCSARLPVYVLFVGVFFTARQGLVIFSLYLLGIVMAIFMGLIFKKTLFKGLSAPFVMELPPYRLPTIKGALIHMWERGSIFIRKAGSIILLVVVLIWFLANLPLGVEYASQESVIGRTGTLTAPVFEPCGFGTWQASVSLLFGFAAKEVVVGTFGTLYGAEEVALGGVIARSFTPLSAYAFLVFTLLYMPCMAAIAIIKRETNSWKWPLFTASYTTILAWIMAVIIYQGGLLLGLA